MDIETAKSLTNPKYQLDSLLASDKFRRDLTAILNKPGQSERFVQVALHALARQPELRECTQASFFAALLRLSEIDMEPDGYMAHLVPFMNRKTGQRDIQLIIDYKGLVQIIRRSPSIAVIKGNVIHKNDGFLYEEGSSRVFKHVPKFIEGDPVIAAYSFVKFAQIDDWEVDILQLHRIKEVRERSRAKDSGPWVTDFIEMAIKTAIRHHAKTLPLRSIERAAVISDDDQYDFNPFSRNESARLPQTTPKFDERDDRAPVADVPKEEVQSEPNDVDAIGVSAGPRSVAAEPQATRPRGRPRKVVDQQSETTQSLESKTTPSVTQSEPPAKPDANTSQAPVSDVSQEPVVVENTPEIGPVMVPAAEVAANVTELLRKINSLGISQSDVIAVLAQYEVPGINAAQQTGLVMNLPKEAVDLCIKQWASVAFNVHKLRKAPEPEWQP